MPKLRTEPVSVASVSGSSPLKYDSGVKYDDPEAYYDLWYPASGSPFGQGERPKARADLTPKGLNINQECVKIGKTKGKR